MKIRINMFLQIVYKSEKLEMTEYGGQEMVWWEEKKKKKKALVLQMRPECKHSVESWVSLQSSHIRTARQILGACWIASLAEEASVWFNKRPCL